MNQVYEIWTAARALLATFSLGDFGKTVVSLLVALALIALFDWWWSDKGVQKRPARTSEVDELLQEITELRTMYEEPVRFMAASNLQIMLLLLVGIFYLAGANLFKWNDAAAWINSHISLVDPSMVEITLWFLYTLFAFYFLRKCRSFWDFCRIYMDFPAHERMMQAKIDAMRKNIVVAPKEIVVGPEIKDTQPEQVLQENAGEMPPNPPGAGEASQPTRDSPAATATGADERQRIPQWKTGRVTQWPSNGYFGFIDGDAAFGDGLGGTRYWTNVLRLATDKAPGVGAEVAFLEGAATGVGKDKVAALVATIGLMCEGAIVSFPKNRRYCFAEISDEQGNKAQILVLPGEMEEFDVGTGIRFELSRNQYGPIGVNPERLTEKAAPVKADTLETRKKGSEAAPRAQGGSEQKIAKSGRGGNLIELEFIITDKAKVMKLRHMKLLETWRREANAFQVNLSEVKDANPERFVLKLVGRQEDVEKVVRNLKLRA